MMRWSAYRVCVGEIELQYWLVANQTLLTPSCYGERWTGGLYPKTNKIVTNICSCHNFFPLSSVQIIIIPACCLLCVL